MINCGVKKFIQNYVILTNFLPYINCLAFDLRTANQMVISELVNHIQHDPTYIINEILMIVDILKDHDQNIEDVSLNITELVPKYCCPIEEHYVETLDGYILTMFRIQANGPPVFLMHGLFNSADDWVVAGPKSALAYILASAGYDVWFGNSRGNKYSREHITLSPNQSEFWDFSWDEIGRYDLPAMVDYVLNTTKESQLAYIGHSQGTTCFFVLCSERPEYNDKFSIMIALSPIAWMGHINSLAVKLAAPYLLHNSWLFKLFNYHELVPKNKETLSSLCSIGNGIICLSALFTLCGFDYEQVNKTNTLSIFGHLSSGASLYQVLHYMQSIVSKNFQRYDYGQDKNEEIYGCTKPPKYQVENISAPVALIYSDNDWFSNTLDLLILKSKLQKVVAFHRVPYKKFNVLDYVYAKDVKRLVYSKVLYLLQNVIQSSESV